MSKKAIGYIRISTKEQSNYSLSGQRSEIETYCIKHDISLLSVFEDDGQSAKNFDRISWQELESYIALNHKAIDYLIVYKYDRFSRNLAEALAMMEKLEKKYKITILSILENIGVHPKSPVFFSFRTQILLNANNDAVDKKNRELSALESKIDGIEEKYIVNKLDDETYRKWKTRYESERMFLMHDIEELSEPIANTWKRYESSLHKLSDIAYIYNSSSMHSKKAFINVVFDNKLSYQSGTYRTLFLTPIYAHKALILNEKGLLKVEQSFTETSVSSLSAAKESNIEHFMRLMKWITEAA